VSPNLPSAADGVSQMILWRALPRLGFSACSICSLNLRRIHFHLIPDFCFSLSSKSFALTLLIRTHPFFLILGIAFYPLFVDLMSFVPLSHKGQDPRLLLWVIFICYLLECVFLLLDRLSGRFAFRPAMLKFSSSFASKRHFCLSSATSSLCPSSFEYPQLFFLRRPIISRAP